MRIMRRSLLAFTIGLVGATAFQLLDFAEALDGARRAVEARATPPLNLGDCLRTQKPKDWPAPYLAICQDLTLEPATLFRTDVGAIAPVAPASPTAARVKPTPRPVARITVKESIPARVAPVVFADTCQIDEQGRTVRRIKGVTHISAPAPAEQRTANRQQSGTALLIETACTVKSPLAGKVAYAGEFKGYRGVVILRLKSGRQLIIAGFDRLDVKRGQTIARGAFLGASTLMPAPALASAYRDAYTQRSQRTFLYFDMRTAKGDSQAITWLPASTRISELAAK